MDIKTIIADGATALGIELGSTRIKAVLIGPDSHPLATGGYSWENQYEDGIWTYHLDEVWTGLQTCYAELAENVKKQYGAELRNVGSLGISGMMHGYLAFDRTGSQLAPFRTWRNTVTGPAAAALTELFQFHVPQRWSISHLYQNMLDGADHVKEIAYLTTLSGYVHWKLTGKRVMGVGEASGMFPIDSETGDYDQTMVEKFDGLAADYPWTLRDILPQVLTAGMAAGVLTQGGARLLDPTGTLEAGIPMCPPEGDAGTGMVATNSVAIHTGNVSAGTSIFSMIVLDQSLSKVYKEIDLVMTPVGKPVAMVQCNNCTNEINTWANVFREFLEAMGLQADTNGIYTAMFRAALQGRADAGGVLLYNYLSGEAVTGFNAGCPLLVRTPESRLDFANLMRTQLYAALATLRLGLDILEQEKVQLDRIFAHGGYFKTPLVGQRMMAAAVNAPVSVMETAGEGGAWGIALLAAYLIRKKEGQTLEQYLETEVFADAKCITTVPEQKDVDGFRAYMARYTRGLPVERAAVEYLMKA